MKFNPDDYDCYRDAGGDAVCELEDAGGVKKRALSGCLDGAGAVGTALSIAKPVVDVEPTASVAVRAGGCSVGAYREWSKPEKVVFIEGE